MQNVKFVPHPLGPKCSNEPKICQTTPPHRSTLHLAKAVPSSGSSERSPSRVVRVVPVIWADTSGDEWMRVYTRSTVHSTSFTSNHWIDFNFYVFSDPNLTSKTPACRMFRAISEKHRYLHDIEIYRISLQGFASLIIGSSSSITILSFSNPSSPWIQTGVLVGNQEYRSLCVDLSSVFAFPSSAHVSELWFCPRLNQWDSPCANVLSLSGPKSVHQSCW